MNLQRVTATDLQIATIMILGRIANTGRRRRAIPFHLIAALPREQSRALLLSVAGLTYKQIAVITDVTNDVALRRLSQAYHQINMRRTR